MSFELKDLIPNVELCIKLKLLKIAIRCGNFKISAEKKNILKIQKQLPFGQKMANYWQLFL
jgi:hypothetical protein